MEARSKDFVPSAQSSDFAKDNILSYVYETKDHKAYEYRKKNDHV
jgi:hypothetical protein